MKRKILYDARKSRELTQLQVATYLGVSKQQYSRIELGQMVGSVRIWDKLEDFFNIPQRKLRELDESDN